MSLTITRKKRQMIKVGSVTVGGNAPIRVQSMTNTYTQDVKATVLQINNLTKAGCEIIRVAVPDMEAAQSIKKIKEKITIPVIADIHFDYKLAIACSNAGADGLRLNPGNIGEKKKIKAVADCAKEKNIPIRIGINAGSLEKDIAQKMGITSKAMVASCMRNIEILRDLDFHNIKISLKASNVLQTIEAYRLISLKTDVPLHVGITEAGGLYAGIAKSSIGIGMLLAEGIGDTIRVSLTRDPMEEIRTAWEILRALDIRKRGPEIISCPTCGRCKIDLFKIAGQVENALIKSSSTIKVAIMGCIVNGPGEAKEADLGIAGGDGTGVLFKKGKIVRKIKENMLVKALLYEIDKYQKDLGEINGEKK